VELRTFSPRLGDCMDIAEKRRRLLRFHWVEMEIMEVLASWSETMVYLPVRAGVGRQIWEQSLHCDAISWAHRNLKHLGRSAIARAPSNEFVRYCEQLHAVADPALRLVGLYRVVMPALASAEREYLDATDSLADANSKLALERCVQNHAEQQRWADQMLETLLVTPAERRHAAEFAAAQQIALLNAGGIDVDGERAYYLPYHGWPEHEEATAIRTVVPTAVGQWQSEGYHYTKSFERGIIHLQWDRRFRYAESPEELEASPPKGSVDGLIHWLHGLFHGECQTVDRMGLLLVDFPDLPWDMRKDMAQQAWEEARHMQIVAQLIEGLGGSLGQYPFPPYFAHLRRDHHHPVMHMVMGNIMGEGSVAAQTNEALKYTVDWGNDWLSHGLEHLSGDEVVHVNFGKRWGQQLSRTDRLQYWELGKARAYDTVAAVVAVQQAFGLNPDAQKQLARVDREFDAFVSRQPVAEISSPGDRGEY